MRIPVLIFLLSFLVILLFFLINSQLLTTTKNKNKSKLGKQLEQEQNHRDGDHMEGYLIVS